MNPIKKFFPVWVKDPVAVYLREKKHFPLPLVMSHMYQSCAINGNWKETTKNRARTVAQKKNYKYLCERYLEEAKRFAADFSEGEKPDEMAIWVFWWQGMDQAPEIVKRCVNSMKRNFPGHPVHVIDQRNFHQYASVPADLLERIQNKTLSLTHFSDYYRMALLAQNGGLWIDASIYVRREAPKEIFEHPIFTVRNPGKDTTNISNWNWMVGVLGGWKKNVLFCTVAHLLELYWKDHTCLIDYFMFDYMVHMVYENIPMVHDLISQVAPSNKDFYDLQEYANSPLEQYKDRFVNHTDTWMYKISWKGQYQAMNSEGKNTIYGQWIKESDPGREEDIL